MYAIACGISTTIDASAFTADSTTTSVYDDNDRLLSEATDEDTDSVIDEFIQYDYAGTVQAAKTVHDGADGAAPVAERTTHGYNARGRQDKVEIDNDGDATVDVTTEYSYNDSGIRIKQIVTQAGQASSITEFIIDASNPTGYAQTIEEITDSSVTKSYTLGLDVISQAINDSGLTGTLQTYLYDGHGSVRQLVDAVGQVVKAALDSIGGAEVLKLDYNAYGQAINFAAATAVTTLLYSGEFTDAATGQQYLRARFYDPATGRFNRVDPFSGVISEPQSLHKCLYGHGDPINNVDPSGEVAAALIAGALGAGALVFALPQLFAFDGSPKQVLSSALFGALGATAIAMAPNKPAALTAGIVGGLLNGFIMWAGEQLRIQSGRSQIGLAPNPSKYWDAIALGFGVSSLQAALQLNGNKPILSVIGPTALHGLGSIASSLIKGQAIDWGAVGVQFGQSVLIGALTNPLILQSMSAPNAVEISKSILKDYGILYGMFTTFIFSLNIHVYTP